MDFQNFDIDLFLREYWQKKPLLIRSPWGHWQNPLEPDELAGLACEEEVESRLICQSSSGWDMEQGPQGEERLAGLGESHWTLLVQAVDQHVPAVADLIAPFRFIPNWRIDDVMVSLAADEGGVGPHFDQYDVFLIQGLGRRRWQIGPHCDAETTLLPHDDLKLLAEFEPLEEWVLEPGDILYVPPGIAHNGVAVGPDCMTYSVGFRAPSRSDLLGHFVDDVLESIPDDDLYRDPDLKRQDNPGEISPEALARLQQMMLESLSDPVSFARWFGAFNSTPKYADMDWRPEEPLEADDVRLAMSEGSPLLRNPASRMVFIANGTDALTLFADGECFDCTGDLAELARNICAHDRIVLDSGLATTSAAIDLVTQLCNMGCVAFESEE
ncbi:JmjC domain-containing protein [Sphingorhabdus sp.]|uniref:ribosomal protein uL16 3-hydroxylase n=1 Tax=Sphingorhabdus sp. TaxID=1902408 RepID=UPI003919D84C